MKEKSTQNTFTNKNNKKIIGQLGKRVSYLRRFVVLVSVLLVAIFLLIFVNGMLIHRQTGLDEDQNQVFTR